MIEKMYKNKFANQINQKSMIEQRLAAAPPPSPPPLMKLGMVSEVSAPAEIRVVNFSKNLSTVGAKNLETCRMSETKIRNSVGSHNRKSGILSAVGSYYTKNSFHF